MTATIFLTEFQDQPAPLSQEDAAFIASQLAGRIAIRRAFTGDAYVLNAGQFVGLLTLPSGVRVECQPKVPVRNLFVMLAVAYDLPDPFLDQPAELAHIEDLLDVMVGRFVALVDQQIGRGVYRAYIEDEGNLPMVRGRIAVLEDVRANHILRHRIYCRFTEYSWDVPENRVLRQVVRLLMHRVATPALRLRLRALDAVMEDITPGRYVASDLDRFVYHRLNEEYRPLHQLCRLFLEGLSPSESAGPNPFNAFLLDMNRLFETFVSRVLMAQMPAPFSVHAQWSTSLADDGQVPMRPDLVVRRHGTAVLVADCKYKRIDPGEHRQHDLYQVLAYCMAIDVPAGVLIYPRHLAAISTWIQVRNADVTITEVTLDLSGDALRLEQACLDLTAMVTGLVAGSK